jgi:hypothetical protein
MKTPTYFGTHVPSSESYCNKSLRDKLLIYVFIFKGLIKMLVVKIHEVYRKYKIDNYLQSSDNTLSISRHGSCLQI